MVVRLKSLAYLLALVSRWKVWQANCANARLDLCPALAVK
jgi:hypothetical protein